MNSENRPVVVGITGASGSILGFRLIQELLYLNQTVELVMTEKSHPVIFEETGLKLAGPDKAFQVFQYLQKLSSQKSSPNSQTPEMDSESLKKRLRVFENSRLDAPPASGTHLTRGMAIIPCSMGTLGRIANGITDTFAARAADVSLKERRPLIVVPRESPLNLIHLNNLKTLEQCGAVILPPMLSFYLPDFNSLEGQINYTVGKVLDQLGFSHTLYTRWGDHH